MIWYDWTGQLIDEVEAPGSLTPLEEQG